MTNKNCISSQNFEEWLRSTGYLFPTNELELARFDKLYADYDFKLKDVSIDSKSIVQGNICSIKAKTLHLTLEDKNLESEIENFNMVARKGEEIPKHIIDKMRQKHHKNDNESEEK